MSDKTKIEWADATWNPVTGCTKVSAGCANCYAERMIDKRGQMGKAIHGVDEPFWRVTTHPERLDQPVRWRKPRRVFLCSMGDLFHEDVTFEFVLSVFHAMYLAEHHVYQILTKRPARMLDFFRWAATKVGVDEMPPPPPSVWFGVSVEDQSTADERIPLLLQTPAAVRFVSCEPMLGPVDLGKNRGLPVFRFADKPIASQCGLSRRVIGVHPELSGRWQRHDASQQSWLDWVICGGETGLNARPMHPDWVRSLRDQCVASGVPFLFKQWGEWAPDCLCATAFPHRTTARPEPGEPGVMFRCGKKAAGRTLDGVTHDEYPEVKT